MSDNYDNYDEDEDDEDECEARLVYGVSISSTRAAKFLEKLSKEIISNGGSVTFMERDDEVLKECKQYLKLDKFVLLGEGAVNGNTGDKWYTSYGGSGGYTLGFEVSQIDSCDISLSDLKKNKVSAKHKSQWANILGPIAKKSGIKAAPSLHLRKSTYYRE